MKPFKASTTGTMKMSKINGPGRLVSVASAFYKVVKIIKGYIKVFGFAMATLVCLHRFSEIINFKPFLPPFMQCNLATELTRSKHAPA